MASKRARVRNKFLKVKKNNNKNLRRKINLLVKNEAGSQDRLSHGFLPYYLQIGRRRNAVKMNV